MSTETASHAEPDPGDVYVEVRIRPDERFVRVEVQEPCFGGLRVVTAAPPPALLQIEVPLSTLTTSAHQLLMGGNLDPLLTVRQQQLGRSQ